MTVDKLEEEIRQLCKHHIFAATYSSEGLTEAAATIDVLRVLDKVTETYKRRLVRSSEELIRVEDGN